MKKKLLVFGTVVTVTLSSAFLSEAVHAQPTTLEEVNEKQEELRDSLSKAEQKIADILVEIKEINEEVETLQYALDENNKQIEKTEEQIAGLEDEINSLNEKIEARNDILKSRMSAYQENGGNIQFLDVVLGAEGFNDFISRVSAATAITNADRELIEANEKDKAIVEEKLTEQEALKQELEEQKETIEIQKEQQEESKKELEEKEEQLQEEKAELESESSDLSALESEIRAEMAAAAAAASAASNDNSSNNNTNNNSNNNGNNNSSNNNSNNGGSSSSESTKSTPYTGGGTSAIQAGYSVTGTPYVWGGTSPSGFDCSGFVTWAYGQEGISLPRTASAMASAGTKVSYSEAKPGDLVLFRGGAHVGIYLGGGKFIGAQNSTGVAVADMNSGYWAQNFDNNVRRIK